MFFARVSRQQLVKQLFSTALRLMLLVVLVRNADLNSSALIAAKIAAIVVPVKFLLRYCSSNVRYSSFYRFR